MAPKKQTRAVSRLHLDLLNPRVGRGVNTEDEAMIRLLDMHGDQILALAKDIAQHGLNPLDAWGIVEENGKLIVVEGNRRLLACKLLLNPEKAPSKQWVLRFKNISLGISPDEIKKVACYIASTRSEMRHWMNVKHQGPGDGEGIAQWTPEMKYLDRVQQGLGREPDKEFWYWLENNYVEELELARDIADARKQQFTTIERIYNWFLKDKLNVMLVKDELEVDADPKALKRFFSVVMEAMCEAGKGTEKFTPRYESIEFSVLNSRTLPNAGTARKVLDAIWNHTVDDDQLITLGVKKNIAGEPGQTLVQENEVSIPSDSNEGRNRIRKSSVSGGTMRSSSRSASERKLYGAVQGFGFLPIHVKNLLKASKQIEIKSDPDIASVLARVVLELLIEVYIKRKQLDLGGKTKLVDKIRKVLQDLDPSIGHKTVARPDLNLTGAWSATNTGEEQGQITKDLNDCVHDPSFTDSVGVAERANQVFTPLIVAMINEMRK